MRIILSILTAVTVLASVSFADWGSQYDRRGDRRYRPRPRPVICYQCMIMTDTGARIYGRTAYSWEDAEYNVKSTCSARVGRNKAAQNKCWDAGVRGADYSIYCDIAP